MPKIALAKKITRNQALSYDRTVPNGLGVTAISAVNGRGSYERFAKNRYQKTRALLKGATPLALSTNGDDMFYYRGKNRAKPNKGMSRKQREKCAPLVTEAVRRAKEALTEIGEKAKPKSRKGGKRKLSPAQEAALREGREKREARRAAKAGKPVKAASKKASPKKAASKKAAPKKAAPKKAAPKKAAPKKAAPKKAAGKGTVAKTKKKAASKSASGAKKKQKFKKVTEIYVKANRRGRKGRYRRNAGEAEFGVVKTGPFASYQPTMERTFYPATAAADVALAPVKGLAAYREKQRAVKLATDAIRAEVAAVKQSKKAAQDALKAVKAANKGKKDKAARAAILAAEAVVDAETAKLKATETVADAKIKAEKAKLKAEKPKKGSKKAKAKVSPPTRYKGQTIYGGTFKTERVRVGSKGRSAPVVKVGNKSFPTYMYVDKKGRGRKIPSWMLAGAPSIEKYKDKDSKYASRLASKREKLAASVSKRILKGTYPFTPNKAKRVFTFKEWQNTMAKKKTGKKARRNPLMQAAANKPRKRSRKHGRAHRNPLMQAAANRRRKHGRARRNPQLATYISNPGLAVDTIVSVLKDSALVGGGLLTHKALTNLVSQKIEFFQKNKYGKSIAAAAVAAVGIPAASLLGRPGEKLGIGMGAALIHTVLVNVLAVAGQADAVSYLGDYTEADMSLPAGGYGSYYEFTPGEVYSGMGEYIQQTGPLAGFGEPMLAQAAAGFGASPLLAQAAAGVGEYIVTGAEGIGEYEQVTPEYTQPSVVREGISPNLGSAEAALSVAEAAAGVGGLGNVDLALEQTVYPTGQALDITDAPGGSRSGVFYGGNGVFGP